ncbi:hypothetical protein HB943_08715 [Listeria weihenstephanensis]|uniref:Uncharacterized protein n=1 Tax=Listeria weihenstephanensis TaxID=1006155 RepID=A0A841Z607_9LIST|nr:hypothetical protein [Listeria weihenstephanensis]MBC1500684.1 hypothetical protein [Listeria weihenstephanensis]
MAKWGGLLLSEHTAHLEASKQSPVWQLVMEQEAIYQVLQEVSQHRAEFVIQRFKEEGQKPDSFIEGRVVGVEAN